jgi:hypothetical protein
MVVLVDYFQLQASLDLQFSTVRALVRGPMGTAHERFQFDCAVLFSRERVDEGFEGIGRNPLLNQSVPDRKRQRIETPFHEHQLQFTAE